ncbi:MAG: PAS domain-containing protein, partial [bacterium]
MNINEAKKKLKASEEKYRRLFETARDGILILDGVSGEIQDANPYFLEITGYSFAELEGSAPWELAAFGDIIENKNRFEKLKENGVARYDDLPLLTKDGEEIPVEFITNTYQAGGNRVVQCNIRVIKERKELEKKMRLYSQSVKEAAFEVYWINRGGGFDYANKQAARRLGCPAEDLGTKAVWDVDPNFSREEWFEHWEELKKIGVRKFETEHIGAGGEVYPVEITSNYIRHNGNEYELAFAQDISERKNYEQKLEEEREMFILGPTLIFRWGADSENKWPVEYVSPNVTDLLGYEREEFMDKKINYKEII